MNKPHDRRIAIVGGGPGGLTLARLLQMNGLDVTVFEADASVDARDQGGTLDLHADGGQAALAAAGLLDAFHSLARHEDQGTRILDHRTAEPLFDAPSPPDGDRPEIDRKALRDLLLGSLAPDTVQWNAKLQALLPEADGRYRLQLPDRQSAPFDLVVGADGAWSKVRTALSDLVPVYTGTTFIELWIEDADRSHPALARLVGHGTMFALHASKGIVAQRNGHGRIRIYAALPLPERPRDQSNTAGLSPDEIKAVLHQEFAGWSPALLALVDAANARTFERPILSLPPRTAWTHRAGLTLLGDAAHVMPPMGIGVNLAMLEALELGTALISTTDWDTAIRAFETKMQARSDAYIAETLEGFAELFAPDTPRSVLEHMRSVHAA